MLSYYIALALWAVGLYIWWRVDRSMDRYALDAASQDEDAAASVGIDVTREKLKITAISAAMCAVGGAIYAQYQMYIGPDTIAGLERLAQHRVRRDRRRHVGDARADRRRGVHAGALRSAARHDPELGRLADRSSARRCSRSTRMIYGLLLILFIIYMPKGILGTILEWREKRHSRIAATPVKAM